MKSARRLAFLVSVLATGALMVGAQGIDFKGTSDPLYLIRGIQGSKSKTLTDAAAATPVIRVPVATNSFQDGEVVWHATSVEGANRRTVLGRIRFGATDKAGTPVCGIGLVGSDLYIPAFVGDAATLACTWTNVVNTTNCDLSATCTDDTAGDQTITINVRPDMTTTATLVYP